MEIGRLFARLIHRGSLDRSRPGRVEVSPVLVSVSAVILGLLAGCILILFTGHNPFDALLKIVSGALSTRRRIFNTLAYSTQLILTGLSVAFALKTGLLNIGGSGQMLAGGICSTLLASLAPAGIPRPVLLPLMLVTAVVAGGLWGGIAGLLKARFNVHEVVSTIMLNWTAYWFVYDLIPAFILDPEISVRSAVLSDNRTLRSPLLAAFSNTPFFNYGFFIAIIAVILVWFVLEKTTLGFSLKATGANKSCAEYAGINVQKSIILSMAVSGSLAGLAGLSFFCGYSNMMEMGKMPSEGFDAIAVALLGDCAPLGVAVAAVFFGILKMGRGFLSAATGIPMEIADIIIATIIYFSATSIIFSRFWGRVFKHFNEKHANARSIPESPIENSVEPHGNLEPPNSGRASSASIRQNTEENDE